MKFLTTPMERAHQSYTNYIKNSFFSNLEIEHLVRNGSLNFQLSLFLQKAFEAILAEKNKQNINNY